MALSQQELEQLYDNALAAQLHISPEEARAWRFRPQADEPEEESALGQIIGAVKRAPGQAVSGFGNAFIDSTLGPVAAAYDYLAGDGNELTLPARAVQETKRNITNAMGGEAQNTAESLVQGLGSVGGYLASNVALRAILGSLVGGPVGGALGAGSGIISALAKYSPRLATGLKTAMPMVRAGIGEAVAEGSQSYFDKFENSGGNRNAAARAALGNTAVNIPLNAITSALGYGVANQATRGAVSNALGKLMSRQAAERVADKATAALSAYLSEGAQETAQNLSSQYWGGDQPLSEVLSGENIGTQAGEAGNIGGTVGLITDLALRGLGARQLRRAARGLPSDASVEADIRQLQGRKDASENQRVIDALAALNEQKNAQADYAQSGYADTQLDAVNRAFSSRDRAQEILRALEREDEAPKSQRQRPQPIQLPQTAEQGNATQSETATDVQALLNGVRSDLERADGILAENTDQRVVDAFERYRSRLDRAQTSLDSAAKMKTGKKRAENIESARRDIESANETIFAFRDLLANNSQLQATQTARIPQAPQAQSVAQQPQQPAQAEPAPQPQRPIRAEPMPQPAIGNESRAQVLSELITKRENELDERLKKSKGRHTPSIKHLNSIIKDLRRELESYEAEPTAAPQSASRTESTIAPVAQPQQTEMPERVVEINDEEQTVPPATAQVEPTVPTDRGELLLDPSPQVIEQAQAEVDEANKEIEAVAKRLQSLGEDDRRAETLEAKRVSAENRRQRAESLMRPQRVSRLRPDAIVTDFNVPVGRLNAARKANSDYLNTTLVQPLRDLRGTLVKTKMGKYEKNAVDVVDKVIHGVELYGNAGMSSQDALDFFNGVSDRVGTNTPNGRMIAHSASNIAKLLAYPDVQTAMHNLNEINQRIASSEKTGVTYHRDNNTAAFQAQERMLSQERMNGILAAEDQSEPAVEEAAREEAAQIETPPSPVQPPAPIPDERRQEGTVGNPEEARLRAGARENRRQKRVAVARQAVAEDAARRDMAVMERANRVELPESTINLNLRTNQEDPRIMADFATKVDAAIAAMQDESNIAPDRRDSAESQLRMLRTIRSAWENGTPEQVAQALKDSGLIIGNYASYDAYSDVDQTRTAEGQRSNRRTTRNNPFGSRVETQLNDDGSANTSAEVRGTTQASDEGGAVYGKIGGIDMTERETFSPLPLVSGALEKAEQTQRTQSRQKNNYNKAREIESTLPRYEDNDFYDPAKREEIIALIKKQSSMAKKASSKTAKAGVKPRLLEYAARADAIRKQLESGDRDAISVASVGVDNSKFNFGFDTQGRIDRGKTGLTVDDIIAGKKASVDTGNASELFDVNRDSVQRLFGAKSRVAENDDGSFTVKTPSGARIQIVSSGDIMMSPEAIETTWGKEMADRVRRGDAAVVGGFDLRDGIPLIELGKGIATNFTANHELFHAAASLALTPDQTRTLHRRFGGNNLTDAQVEERIADGYAQWREGRLLPTSKIRAIFRRIMDFFNGVRAMFTGENFEDVFRDIESGRVWENDEAQPGSPRGEETSQQPNDGYPGDAGQETGDGPSQRPSIIATSEQARREGERVVSEGQKNVSTINKYLEPNGGNGAGQKVLDAVVPLFFNSNRMVGRILGWRVFDQLERGIATSPGKAVYKIEHGDADAGVKGFGEILGDIPAHLRDKFETTAAYYNLRDIAGDRRLLTEQREQLKALAGDELRNAVVIRRDLRKNRAIYSGEEIRQYEDAIEGCRKMAKEYSKEAADIQRALNHKQSDKRGEWYDAEINKALAEHPEWEEKIQDLIKWGQYQLQEFVDMGVVSPETAEKARAAHPNYIPLMRNEESNLFESLDQTAARYQHGMLDLGNPLKRYTGGSDATLASPVEQLVNMQYRIESMKARQEVLGMVAEGIEAGRYEDLFRRIENSEELRRGESAMTIYRNGEKITYAVDGAVKALVDAHNPQQPTKLDEILRIPGKLLRGGVTNSPSFAISNAIRDTFTASIINPEVRPVIDTVRGLMSVLTKDSKFDDFLKHGGDQQMNWSTREQRSRKASELYKKTETIANPKSVARYVWNFLGSLAETSELATRVGTYSRLVESGVSPDEAAFRTIDTLWFGRGGTASRSQYGRNIPFFNAALQGTYSLAKTFSKDGHFQWNPKVAMNALLYLTVPSMLLTMWNLGDDDRREKYLEIPEQQKNANWNLVLGDTVLKVPKPHAEGIIFSSLAERFMDHLYANDQRAFDGLAGSLIDSIGPDMTPSFMRLPFELMLNKSLFYQRDIVPAWEQQYEPRDQYGPYTSDTARWMANAIYAGTSPILNLLGEDGWQVSPRKIEYAVSQLTGNLGRDLLTKSDVIPRAIEGKTLPSREWHQDYAITKRFVSSADRMKKTENDFREELDDALTSVSSAALHAKTKGTASLSERDRRALGAKDAIQGLQTKELRAISTLRREIRDIEGNARMDGEQKRKLMDVREKKIRQISQAGLAKLRRVWNR